MNADMLRRHLAGLRVHPDGTKYIVSSALAPPQILLRSGPQHNLTGDITTKLCTHLDDANDGPVVSRWQVESLSVEYAFLIDLESRGDIVFAINHPLPVPLTIINKRGRRQRIEYTPDALVVDTKSAKVIELKTDTEADELVRAKPGQWRRTKDGYQYNTAKEHFRSIGLQYEVVVSSSLPWIRTRNQQFLLRQAMPAPDAPRDRRIIGFVTRRAPVSIEQITASCGLKNASPVLRLIQAGRLHADLDHALLSSPDSAFVCMSSTQARNATVGFASIQDTAQTSATVSVDQTGDPRHLDELGFRMATIQGQPTQRASKVTPCRRTVQRWAKAFKEGGALSLSPGWSRCGRRGPRLISWHSTLLSSVITEARSSIKDASRIGAYGDYEDALKKEAKKHRCRADPVHYSTFCRLWKQRDHSPEDAIARGGRRLANAVTPYADVDKQIVAEDGPFQIAHIDHCLAPSFTGGHDHGKGKPWLSIFVDDWRGEPIACVMTMDYPSHRTDLRLLRECARRHGRIPHTIFSDHGSDFMGNVFVCALAALGASSLYRPETHPRTGQRVERTFGTFATTVCKGYVGFAVDIHNARAISRKKQPSRGPKRDFNELLQKTEHLLFEVIPNLRPLEGGESKHDARLRFEKLYGKQGIPVKVDLTFLIMTAPPLGERGCIEPSGAIRLKDDQRFYAEALIGRPLRKRDLSLRREPEDPTVLYFALDGEWHVAKSRRARRSRGRSDESIRREARSMRRATAEERAERRRALHSRPSRTSTRPQPKHDTVHRRASKRRSSGAKPRAVVIAAPLPTLQLPLGI